eukprot:PLAT3450.1.p1 GENE.PLAT3450.1~~PLAT3450.1.p1  ORF type:complete len:163 (+),score=36.14 PLAT3450.1:58-546(+)
MRSVIVALLALACGCWALHMPPRLLEVMSKVRTPGGEMDEASGLPAHPYEHYFKRDSWGYPRHAHSPWKKQIGMDGRNYNSKLRERTFKRGDPHTQGNQYVQPCETFPFCNYIPPPPPLVPHPADLEAPAPGNVYPVLNDHPKTDYSYSLGAVPRPLRTAFT